MKNSLKSSTLSKWKDIFSFKPICIFIVFLVTFITSCKNNDFLIKDDNTENLHLSVEQAKSWFEKNISNYKVVSPANPDGLYNILYWAKAIEKIDNNTGKTFIEIPVIESKSSEIPKEYLNNLGEQLLAKNALSNSPYTYLKVYINSNNLPDYKVITQIPNKEYYKSPNAQLNRFTGNKILKDWSGNVLDGFEVKEDVEISKYSDIKNVNKSKLTSVQSLSLLALCSFDYYVFVVDIQGGVPTITGYKQTVYFDCNNSSDLGGVGYIPSSGGGGEAPLSANAIEKAHSIADGLGLSAVENIVGKDPSRNLPILNPCQQKAYFDYVSTAANLEHDYELAKQECLNTYVGTAATTNVVALASGQVSFKSFVEWWNSTGKSKYQSNKSGAVRGFLGVLSGSMILARNCIETKLNDTNYKILAARKLFDKQYSGTCQ